jgi:hypothetical protein
MNNNKLDTFLKYIFKNINIYFYTIDNLFNKIIIFSGWYILEISLKNKWWYIKKWNYFYFFIRKFEDIQNIYNFVNIKEKRKNNKDISNIVNIILKYEWIINTLYLEQNNNFIKNNFNKIKTNKKVLLILKWWWMEETIEKSFIFYCNNSNINLTVLYKFWLWYWWQVLNQDWFFNELKANNRNVNFVYKEDFDDNYIDTIIDNSIEVFSFQYDYKWKYKNLNMIILSSVTNDEIDCNRYKNIFSSYESKSIWYSTDKFINFEKTNIYKTFNAQNIDLLNNYSIIRGIDKFILSWWMEWARDFTILNSLNWKYKWILISDEIFDIKSFLCIYRGIQSYYWFLWAYILSDFFIACHLDEFNDDDRSKMIATSICAWKPVIIPYNDWKIVKTILDNKLWIVYKNWDWEDLYNKIRFFSENSDNVVEYWENCKKYSKDKMDINKFINLIFEKSLK